MPLPEIWPVCQIEDSDDSGDDDSNEEDTISMGSKGIESPNTFDGDLASSPDRGLRRQWR